MVTLILSLVAALAKALPEIVSFVRELHAEHKQRDIQLQDLTAKQRYEIKQQATVNAVKLAIGTARDRVQGNVTDIKLDNLKTDKQ